MMDVVAELGSPGLCLTTAALFACWLWVAGFTRIVFGFVVGLALAAAATFALKWLFATPGSTLWPDGALVSQYFPSGHTALAAALYGSLAVALARAGGGPWRWAPMLALAVAVAVGATRVASRTHPAGDAIAGLTIGLLGPVATYWALTQEARPLPDAIRIFAMFLVSLSVGWVLPAPVAALVRF
jgi:membrane-associated phospholipid phosphatase